MIELLKKRRVASSILGLALDGNRLEGVVVRRLNGTLQVKETVTATLALSPLSGDSELVGREIRNHLDQAGIRERRCALCIPLSWVMTLHTKLPDLPDEDINSLLQLEAERGFPSGNENLLIVHSRFRAADGEQHATLMAIPRSHLETLEKALKAAQLKPVSFSLGVAALEGPGKDARGALTLSLGNHSVELEAASGGGIAALRSLDGAVETEGAQKRMDTELVAREIRITLGQLPSELGQGVRSVRVFARGELARQFVTDISPRLDAMGLRLETMDRASAAQFDRALPPEIALSPALAVAANQVRGVMSGPEFLPPRVHPIQQFVNTRLGSKKLAWAGAAALLVIVVVGGMFIWQESQLLYWRGQSKRIEPRVKVVEAAENQIKTYRPWFDESAPALRILRQLTEAFPETGVVTAKTIQVRNLSEVTCSGVARDNQSYRRMLDQLGAAKCVVTDQSLRGQSPSMQFTFTLRWEGDANGN